MKIKFNKLVWKFIVLGIWLTAVFAFSSCTCGDKGDEDTNNDTDDDNDDTDNDDTDDDDDAEGWHIYTIDPELGNFPSIAVDLNNKVHIAYYVDDRDLVYATNKSGAWELTNVEYEDSGQVGYYVHLALDSNNKAHISYYDPYTKLKYATNRSGSWQISVVKDGLTSGENGNNSMGVDSNDKVHITFFHCGGLNEDGECSIGDLKYATNKTGSWQISTIDAPSSDTEAGRDYLSLAVDSNDKLHVSYYKCSDCGMMGGSAELWYATDAAGSWQKTEVGSDVFGDFFGGYNSISVDSSGKVHISFYDKNQNLSYATNTSGAWEIVTIDLTERAGKRNSVAVDSTGKVHIGYTIDCNNALKYITNKTGEWQTLTVNSEEGIDSSFPSISIDSNDYVHISYISINGVQYATNRPPE